jgi:hypothetical protein
MMNLSAEVDSAHDSLKKKIAGIKNGERHPSLDVGLSVTLFPVSEGKTLAMVFCENKDMLNAFKDMQFETVNGKVQAFQPYPLYDGLQDDMPAHEYKKRVNEWEGALNEQGIPSESGFSITLVDGNKQLELLPYQVSKVDIYNRAIELVETLDRRPFAIEALEQFNLKKYGFDVVYQPGRMSSYINAFENWVKNDPQGQKAMQETSKQVDTIFSSISSHFQFSIESLKQKNRMR